MSQTTYPPELANCELFAIDLDGTLLDSHGRVPARNRAALHAAHEAGVKIVLCTGRSLPETEAIMTAIGLDLDAVITSGGALVSDARSRATIQSFRMPIPLALQVRDWAFAHQFTPLWLLDRCEYDFDGFALGRDEQHPALQRWLAKTPCKLRTSADLPEPHATPLRLAVVHDSDKLATIAPTLHETLPGQLEYNLLVAKIYDISVLEIFAARVNKWRAVAWLCDHWNIATTATAGIGDDVNDVPLLQNVGIGFAMANAKPELREVTPHRAAANDDCGVADVLEAMLAAKNG